MGSALEDLPIQAGEKYLKELQWKNSQKISGDIPAEISRLKKQDGPLLQVHGSWQLIQTLLADELIDEFRLWTFPVVVGSGKRLFADGAVPASLKLTKFETCPCGAFMNFWRSTQSISPWQAHPMRLLCAHFVCCKQPLMLVVMPNKIRGNNEF